MRSPSLRGLNPSSEELKKIIELLARKRGIKDNENMPKDKLLSALKASKNKNKTRIEKIREKIKKLQHKFSRSEIKEIKIKLYEIENKKGLSASKKTKKYLDKLEEEIYKLKTYYDYDDAEYKGIKDIEGLFDSSVKIIISQKKSMVLLIITIFSMKVKEIKIKY